MQLLISVAMATSGLLVGRCLGTCVVHSNKLPWKRGGGERERERERERGGWKGERGMAIVQAHYWQTTPVNMPCPLLAFLLLVPNTDPVVSYLCVPVHPTPFLEIHIGKP